MSKFKTMSGGNYGDWTPALVRFKEDKVGICPITEDGTVLTDNKNVIVVSKKNCPSNLFEGKHVVQLSEDKKSITTFHPYSGIHPAKFTRFTNKKDQPPAPKTNVSRKNGEEFQTFTSLFEIVDGAYKGATDILYTLYYNFTPDEQGITAFKGGGKGTQKLKEFLDYIGLSDLDPPPWPDSGNILPGLQRLAQRSAQAGKTVGLVFKNGFVDTLVELESSGNTPPWKKPPDAE